MNITGAIDKADKPMAGRHIAEFLLERCHGQ
jgi:L-lactate dehydrogenase complex protein LldE